MNHPLTPETSDEPLAPGQRLPLSERKQLSAEAVAEIQAKVGSQRNVLPQDAQDPVISSTTGENMITSTFWARNVRRAFIWFSCFCWASENRRSTPRFPASVLMDIVLAVRQALSAPIWE